MDARLSIQLECERRGMNWAIGLLSIGAIVLGTQLDRRRQRERQRLPRPEIHRWEEEGGAVPVSGARTAAQTKTPTAP
jgi:hypothetical protein